MESLAVLTPPVIARTLFFHRWFEVLDLIVIAVSTIITVIYVIIDDHETEDEDTGEIVITYVLLHGYMVGLLVV